MTLLYLIIVLYLRTDLFVAFVVYIMLAASWVDGTTSKYSKSGYDNRSRSYSKSTNRYGLTKDDMQNERSKLKSGMKYDVLKQDNFACTICGRTAKEDGVKLHVDHIKPVSKGGKSVRSNLRTLCQDCNLGKSDKYDADGLN